MPLPGGKRQLPPAGAFSCYNGPDRHNFRAKTVIFTGGVEAIGKDSFRITILAECREEDYRWVQRQLNREIRLLLDREEVPIL